MCKKLQPRRGQHPGERFLLGCENSVFVLGISSRDESATRFGTMYPGAFVEGE